jgi:TetR/AcrR family transcriptional regulator, transcriptional repressor of aconitase
VPKVTDAHRQARREQIADAAVRVLVRNGISDTSIAQISTECGLSIGAIYGNFENKADLARYIATRLFDWRILELDALTDNGTVVTPTDLLTALLASISEANRPAPSVILQFWSKASVDADLREVLAEQVGRLCASAQRALRSWADAETGGSGGAELARRTAQTCMIMSQGFLANRALFGWLDAEEFLVAATVAFGAPDPATAG